MKAKSIAVVGVYGQGPDFTTGQEVKCRELIDWFRKEHGTEQVTVVNTYRWKSNPLKLCWSMVRAFATCRNVILMPAQHGLKVFAPMSRMLKAVFHTGVHYVVIGGWLADALSDNGWLKHCVDSFEGVYVETKSMVGKLHDLGLHRVTFMPNFRNLSNEPVQRPTFDNIPIPVCTYSRVVREKGILDAIAIVEKANEQLGNNVFHLDVYGKIADDFAADMTSALNQHQDIVTYRGVKEADEGVATLAQYFALLFPTYYEGEGFAGTLLDAFAACTPAIANDWKYNSEIVCDGCNGFIYPFRDVDAAADCLCKLYKDPTLYAQIQEGCLQSANRYATDTVLREFDHDLK